MIACLIAALENARDSAQKIVVLLDIEGSSGKQSYLLMTNLFLTKKISKIE